MNKSSKIKHLSIHNQQVFANLLKKHKIILEKDFLIETTHFKGNAVSNHFPNIKTIYLEEINLDKKIILPENFGYLMSHYICNGVYPSTLKNISYVLNYGAFTVGISSDKNKLLNKELYNIYKFYETLEKELTKRGIILKKFEEKDGKTKTLIYHYRSLMKGQEK